MDFCRRRKNWSHSHHRTGRLRELGEIVERERSWIGSERCNVNRRVAVRCLCGVKGQIMQRSLGTDQEATPAGEMLSLRETPTQHTTNGVTGSGRPSKGIKIAKRAGQPWINAASKAGAGIKQLWSKGQRFLPLTVGRKNGPSSLAPSKS